MNRVFFFLIATSQHQEEMNMKKMVFLVLLALLSVVALPLFSADVPKGWGTDYDAALARAAKEKRPVLALFTITAPTPYPSFMMPSVTATAPIPAISSSSG